MESVLEFRDIENVSQALNQNLKCSCCSKILSVGPIYSGVISGNICGRCVNQVKTLISQNVLQRAYAYELLVTDLEFPCCNAPMCGAVLKWGEASKHELTCDGRITCSMPDCYARCDFTKLSKHLFDNHMEYYKKSQKLNINLSVKDEMCFTKKFNRIFILRVRKMSDNVYPPVIQFEVLTDASDYMLYTFSILLKCSICFLESGKTVMEIKRISYKFNADQQLSLNICGCQCPWYDYTATITILQNSAIGSKAESNFTDIEPLNDLINIYQILDIPSSKTSDPQTLTIERANSLNQMNVHVLQELECPVCVNYMEAPIYNCVSGHSICKDCKSATNMCPICKSPHTNGRNFPLEHLSELVEYPCKFEENGCALKFNTNNKKMHILRCPYRTLECPTNCNDPICFNNVKNHFEEKHYDLLFNAETVLSKPVDQYSTSYNYTILDGELFVLKFKCEGKALPTAFDCVGVYSNLRDSYKYHLQFVGNEKGLVFGLDQFCKNDIEELGNDPLVLSIELLKLFIAKNPIACITFKCIISEVE